MKHLRSFTAEFKLEVVEKAEKDRNRETGRYFEVDEKAVRNWRKQKDVIKSMGRKRSNRHGKVKCPALEENLLRWVCDQRNARRSISTVKIRLQAKSMAEEMQITHFKGGINWVYRFMGRKNLRVRSRTTMCRAVLDELLNVSISPGKVSTIRSGFIKAEIVSESKEITDSKDSDAENELLDTLPENILELFNSNTDESDFEGFR
ncbi:pogo transposable element with KRAB [Trichonephila clavipes]|nr:pogo transposable element with KRAB [Trichonephila clavipes]